MDDPARRNALGRAALSDLTAAFADLTNRKARAVILRGGPGNKVWCAGFDIDNLVPGHDPLASDGPLQTRQRSLSGIGRHLPRLNILVLIGPAGNYVRKFMADLPDGLRTIEGPVF